MLPTPNLSEQVKKNHNTGVANILRHRRPESARFLAGIEKLTGTICSFLVLFLFMCFLRKYSKPRLQ